MVGWRWNGGLVRTGHVILCKMLYFVFLYFRILYLWYFVFLSVKFMAGWKWNGVLVRTGPVTLCRTDAPSGKTEASCSLSLMLFYSATLILCQIRPLTLIFWFLDALMLWDTGSDRKTEASFSRSIAFLIRYSDTFLIWYVDILITWCFDALKHIYTGIDRNTEASCSHCHIYFSTLSPWNSDILWL